MKKLADGAGGKLQEKKRGEEKKLLLPGRLVAEVGKVLTREKREIKEERESKEKKENEGEEEEENRKDGTREECQSKDVAGERLECKTEEANDTTKSKTRVNEGIEGREEMVGGEKEEKVTGTAGEVLPDGVVDVDAYCDNREPHVSNASNQVIPSSKELSLECMSSAVLRVRLFHLYLPAAIGSWQHHQEGFPQRVSQSN